MYKLSRQLAIILFLAITVLALGSDAHARGQSMKYIGKEFDPSYVFYHGASRDEIIGKIGQPYRTKEKKSGDRVDTYIIGYVAPPTEKTGMKGALDITYKALFNPGAMFHDDTNQRKYYVRYDHNNRLKRVTVKNNHLG